MKFTALSGGQPKLVCDLRVRKTQRNAKLSLPREMMGSHVLAALIVTVNINAFQIK